MNLIARILFSGLILTVLACGSLEKDIDVELEPYQPRLVVECYLEPGQPYNLLLSQSVDFFEPIDPEQPEQSVFDQLIGGADVRIVHGIDTIVLDNRLGITPRNFFANYIADDLVPEDYTTPFELYITTEEGETAYAKTQMLPPFEIDSVVIEFQEGDTLARALTYYTDDLDEDNFVRRVLYYQTRDSIDQDFVTDDRFVDSEAVAFGTAFEFAPGDTLINSLYHIEEDYYNFVISVYGALDANGNPFAQPGEIQSNIQGPEDPLGIFTFLSYDEVISVVPSP